MFSRWKRKKTEPVDPVIHTLPVDADRGFREAIVEAQAQEKLMRPIWDSENLAKRYEAIRTMLMELEDDPMIVRMFLANLAAGGYFNKQHLYRDYSHIRQSITLPGNRLD